MLAVSFPRRVMIQHVFWETQTGFPLNRVRNAYLGGYILSFFSFCFFLFFFFRVQLGFFSAGLAPRTGLLCRMSWAQLSALGRGREEIPEGQSHSWSVAGYYNYTNTWKPHQKAARGRWLHQHFSRLPAKCPWDYGHTGMNWGERLGKKY